MIPQAKILRVFSLIEILMRDQGSTVAQISYNLDMSERTVWRYFQLLKEIGFKIISKNERYKFPKYRIEKNDLPAFCIAIKQSLN